MTGGVFSDSVPVDLVLGAPSAGLRQITLEIALAAELGVY